MSLNPIKDAYAVGTIIKVQATVSAMPSKITVEYFVESRPLHITENVKYVNKRDGLFGQKRVPAMGDNIYVGAHVDVAYDSKNPTDAIIKNNA